MRMRMRSTQSDAESSEPTPWHQQGNGTRGLPLPHLLLVQRRHACLRWRPSPWPRSAGSLCSGHQGVGAAPLGLVRSKLAFRNFLRKQSKSASGEGKEDQPVRSIRSGMPEDHPSFSQLFCNAARWKGGLQHAHHPPPPQVPSRWPCSVAVSHTGEGGRGARQPLCGPPCLPLSSCCPPPRWRPRWPSAWTRPCPRLQAA